MKRITLNTFRRVAEAEERMIRASMPRTSAANPESLEPFAGTHAPAARVFTLTFKMAETFHASRA